jgi:ankyrin repeat protein
VKPEQLQYQLLRAAEYGDVPKIRALLDLGANVKGRDASDRTPLIYALEMGDAELHGVVEALITLGPDVNAQSHRGRTPLMAAVIRGAAEVVDMLLKRGADPTLKDRTGRTALDRAHPGSKVAVLLETALKDRRKGQVDQAKRERTTKGGAQPNRRPQR